MSEKEYHGLTLAQSGDKNWAWTVAASDKNRWDHVGPNENGFDFPNPGPGLISLNMQQRGHANSWMPLDPDGAIELAKHLILAARAARSHHS